MDNVVRRYTCNNCEWFVEENPNRIGDYQHEIAKKNRRGFCLIQDLFTIVEPDDKACSDFVKESVEMINHCEKERR